MSKAKILKPSDPSKKKGQDREKQYFKAKVLSD